MNRTLVFTSVLIAGLAIGLQWLPAQSAPESSPRVITNFDRDWRFHLGDAPGSEQPAADDSSWRKLSLPHDYSIEGPPGNKAPDMDGPFDKSSPAGAGSAYLNAGIGWYRKTFELPVAAKGQRVSILFDGAYMNAEVWINGQDLGVHPYGFTSFFYDLTPYLKFGDKNVVAVKLDVKLPCCRWYSGAGLYRHVWLVETNPIHLTQWGTYITTPAPAGADLTQPGNVPASADVHVETKLSNDGSGGSPVQLTTILLDPSNQEVGRAVSSTDLPTTGPVSLKQDINVPNAKLWSTESPELYHAVSQISVQGQLVDQTSTPFGIRYCVFSKDKGFFLNGKRVDLQGVCDHHDVGALGSAAYRRALERQLEILRSFGCNAIRTSHNPPSSELLELCDEKGFLVMDEAFDEWKENHHKIGYGDIFDQWSEPDLVSMLDRDRNHPSVIIWSIGNEIMEGREGKPEAGPISERLTAICHREDPSRPVTSACPSPGKDWSSGLARALDVFGINYNTGWYGKNDPAKIPASVKPDDTGYYGQLPLVGSETSSQVDTRGEYSLHLDAQGQVQIASQENYQVSSYDLFHPGWGYSAEDDLMALKSCPWVAGEFVWSGFDYLGEPTPYNWPSRSSYFGIVDLCGFPKDRYYIYQSQWTSQPMVHILPMSWTWPGFEGKSLPIMVFSNADSVELFLNGTSLGVKHIPTDYGTQIQEHKNKDKTVNLTHPPGIHLDWAVPYVPGELKAVASKGGRVVATDTLRTAGAPSQIVVQADRSQIAGTGQDLSYVKVSILDKDGTICPNADNLLKFSISGSAATLAALDNGDPTNHESFQGTQHKAFHGLALAIVKSAEDAKGTVTLTVQSDGLSAASTVINVGQ